MEFEVLEETTNSFSIQVGESILTFMLGEENPFYHFAINIPSFQIQESYKWIKRKVDILSYDGEDIIKFDNWNAEALYFYDADKNLVEFIARKNLNLKSHNEFSKDSLLYVSEIGVPTSNIKKIYDKLNNEFGLEIYDGDLERFCPIGDETGLFIVINYEKKKWFPTMQDAKPVPFEIIFENAEGKIFHVRYANEEINLIE